MRGRFLVPPAMRVGHVPSAKTNLKDNMRDIKDDISNHVRTNYNPKDNFFIKDEAEGRNINNLWSGYKLGGKAKIATTASLLGGGSIVVGDPNGHQNRYNRRTGVKAESEENDIESLQSTRADGVGYQAQVGDMSGLTTSGDLVFAMHKTRHSGQF